MAYNPFLEDEEQDLISPRDRSPIFDENMLAQFDAEPLSVDQTIERDMPTFSSPQNNPELFNQEMNQDIDDAMKELDAEEILAVQPEEQKLQLPEQPSRAKAGDDLAKALQEKRDALQRLSLLRAGSDFGQAAAGRYSGKFDYDDKTIKSLEQLAGQKPEDIKTVRKADAEKELDDPESPTSKFFREMARKALPNVEIPDNLSARYIQKLGLGKPSSGSKRYQQMVTFDPETGTNRIKLFDTATGETKDLDEVKGFSTQFRQDPRTKELIALSPGTSGLVGQVTGKGATPSKEMEELNLKAEQKDYEWKDLNPSQRELFNKVEQDYMKEVELSKELGDTINNIEDLIDSDISAAVPIISRQLGRSVGREVGVMTDKDVEAMAGGRSLKEVIHRFAKKQATGTMTESDKEQFKAIIAKTKENLNKVMNNRGDYHAFRIKKRIPEASRKSLKQLLSVEESKPEGVEDRVKVVSPEGKRGSILKSKLQKALDAGYQLVEE